MKQLSFRLVRPPGGGAKGAGLCKGGRRESEAPPKTWGAHRSRPVGRTKEWAGAGRFMSLSLLGRHHFEVPTAAFPWHLLVWIKEVFLPLDTGAQLGSGPPRDLGSEGRLGKREYCCGERAETGGQGGGTESRGVVGPAGAVTHSPRKP